MITTVILAPYPYNATIRSINKYLSPYLSKIIYEWFISPQTNLILNRKTYRQMCNWGWIYISMQNIDFALKIERGQRYRLVTLDWRYPSRWPKDWEG